MSRNDAVLVCVCVSGGDCVELRRPSRFLVLINPQSGKGQALARFNNHVQHMLQEADITYTLQITGEVTRRGFLSDVIFLSGWFFLHVTSNYRFLDAFFVQRCRHVLNTL